RNRRRAGIAIVWTNRFEQDRHRLRMRDSRGEFEVCSALTGILSDLGENNSSNDAGNYGTGVAGDAPKRTATLRVATTSAPLPRRTVAGAPMPARRASTARTA